MSLELLTTPNKTINGLDSRAAGALLQLPYTFQRQDYLISNVTFSLAGGDPTKQYLFFTFDKFYQEVTEFAVGAVFSYTDIINSAGELIYPGGTAICEYQDQAGPGGASRVRLVAIYEGPNINPVNAFSNNLSIKPNYKVEIRLFDEAGNSLLDNVFRYAPDPLGRLFVNLGTVLADYLFRKQILSQLYKISYSEDWTGKEPEFVTYPFTRITDSGGGDITINFDDIGQDLSEQFPLGFQTFLKFDGSAYTDGLYSITFRNYIAPRFFFVVTAAFAGDDTGTAASNEPVPVPESPVTQATFAAVGNYTEKGSNLVDYLLRAGGITGDFKNLNWPADRFEYIANPDNSPAVWNETNFNQTPQRLYMNAIGLAFQEKTGLISMGRAGGFISSGTNYRVVFKVRYLIKNFVSPGTLRLNVIGRRKDGGWQDLITLNVASITSDTGYIDTDELSGSNFAGADFYEVGMRLINIGGEFDFEFDMQTGFNAFIRNEQQSGAPIYPTAKLLTQFKNPIQWKGWARTCSYLIDPLAEERNNLTDSTRLRVNNYDINKAFVSGEAIINTDLSPRIVTVAIGSFFPNSLAAFRGVYVQGAGSPRDQLTDILYYRILPECNNPIMVEYYNQLGVPEQHLFNITQEIELQATAGTGVTTPVNQDLAGDYSRRIGRRLPDFTQQILCTSENLLPDQYLALQELIYSSEVFIYLDKEGTKKLPVILSGEPSTSKETKDKRLSLQVTLELPLNVRFEDIKLY